MFSVRVAVAYLMARMSLDLFSSNPVLVAVHRGLNTIELLFTSSAIFAEVSRNIFHIVVF